MDYKNEIEKIGWNTKEVANRVESLIEEKVIDIKEDVTEDLSVVIENENNNPILNEFLNK
ncbi:hypothetical protein BUZ11_13885 [Staphylococcus gallinarum]|uniref:hypothetical protein n=1 Tax=Staphylococcus gallinarum TaxID=1293 RepID=UPI000D1C7AEF|nr:hypothetical protein [Staphylococcus gallinarum]MCD8825448.1 hypothetical protein [Staphylococcus gallinarum]MCD8870746.1 hypothetical protein [Staphylococcus gallinarum]MCD8901573.1 hypothetical protein [Staphylococcus gallinarum]MCD8910188.1 hypothetical protein [Staphylococcus gallinarum]MCW0984588.1 hypothetical protein [Staphylococcus gallinarum]